MDRIRLRRLLATALVLACGASGAWAAIRLVYRDTGAPLWWSSMPVPFTIDPAGSDDVHDGSDLEAVRAAFRAWASIAGARVAFDERPAAGAVRHARDGVNAVVFDETNASGLFTRQPQIVAITPVFFDGSGRILEADMIFNGRDHAFSTDLRPGTFDIRNIATHEVGHLLGLDHTGIYGATLMPFAFEQDDRLRSLSEDERAAARAIYPDPAAGVAAGAIEGRVERSDGSGVDSAHVVLVDAARGETVASARTEADGRFRLAGLEPGNYALYAEPLDGPTTSEQLQRPVNDTAFGSAWLGGNASPATVTLPPGQLVQVGALRVRPPAGLNLTGVTPYTAVRGSTVTLTLAGTGLAAGMEVEIPGPDIELLGAPAPNRGTLGSGGSVTVRIAASAAPGIRDIYVYAGSGANRDMAALPGGFEIRAAAPRLDAISPASGASQGGDSAVLTGAGFEPGAEVLFGGVPAASVVWRSTTELGVVTPAHPPGRIAVTVINPDGQQGRKDAAYTYTGRPRIDRVEPSHGPTAGANPVRVLGAQLATGAEVRFGGVSARIVAVSSTGDAIECEAPRASTPGAVDLEVINPDGTSDRLAGGYEYRLPALLDLSPDVGSTSGGATVELLGTDLPPGSTVWFGGAAAGTARFVSTEILRVTAPPHAPGVVDVEIRTPDGHNARRAGAFRYVADPQPVIRRIDPASGPEAGGTVLTLDGDAFEPGAEVEIGGRRARDVLVLSPTEISATTPPGSAGAADVVVRNPSGLEARAYGAFTYTAPAASTSGAATGGGSSFGFCRLGPAGTRHGAWAALAPWLLLAVGLLLARGRLARHRAGA